jgi:hypothetical protein
MTDEAPASAYRFRLPSTGRLAGARHIWLGANCLAGRQSMIQGTVALDETRARAKANFSEQCCVGDQRAQLA